MHKYACHQYLLYFGPVHFTDSVTCISMQAANYAKIQLLITLTLCSLLLSLKG